MTDQEAEPFPDTDQPNLSSGGTRRRIWPFLLLLALVSFTLGLLGNPWFEAKIRGYMPQPPLETAQQSADPRVEALAERLHQLESGQAVAEGLAADPNLAARLEALEVRARTQDQAEASFMAGLQQLGADLDRAKQTIETGDARLRDLFVLSLARRMIDAGRPLDPILPILQARFGEQDAAATDTLAAWSREPQTRSTLAGRLPELDATEAKAAAAQAAGWWDRIKTSFGKMVRVYDPSSPTGLSVADRLGAAEMALRQQDLGLAITRAEEMPQSDAVRQWVHDARLLVDAEGAMDRLDTLALAAAIRAVSAESVEAGR